MSRPTAYRPVGLGNNNALAVRAVGVLKAVSGGAAGAATAEADTLRGMITAAVAKLTAYLATRRVAFMAAILSHWRGALYPGEPPTSP
ncbi:glycerol-3-phosphate acyltransferase PlsY [Kitasatospora sp. MAA19]|nr:glycerol-3-phosphate acyltransferase PlsY [Kitasatospora sp. MAA19]